MPAEPWLTLGLFYFSSGLIFELFCSAWVLLNCATVCHSMEDQVVVVFADGTAISMPMSRYIHYVVTMVTQIATTRYILAPN